MGEVEFTQEFEAWWNTLDEDERESLEASVVLLQSLGPSCRGPTRIPSKVQGTQT